MKIYPIILSVLFSLNLYSQIGADVAIPFSDQVISGIDPITVSIEGVFEDTTISGTVVKFETNAPLADNDFYVELTSNTPLTNANFLSYVNSGAYDNSMFHRSVSNFVIQGGGFKHPTVAADQPEPESNPIAIPTTGTVQNEPGNLNTRGTIAMAKLGGQPDSATSQFFFNLSNNSFLDSDNGGYTQFGSVLGSGMTVVDTIGSASTYDARMYYSNTALSDLPLWNLNEDGIVLPQDFVQIENAYAVTESELFTYSASSSDPAKLTASFNGNGDLVLTPVGDATGTVSVTVIATSSLDDSTASDTFSVTFEPDLFADEIVEPVKETTESAEEAEAAEEDPSWVPEGWVYYAWPYAYSFSESRWHFFNELDTQYRVNLSSGAWGTLDAASGWNYYAWPYSYSFDEGAWHWYNNDTQWVVDLLSGEWSTFGSSGN